MREQREERGSAMPFLPIAMHKLQQLLQAFVCFLLLAMKSSAAYVESSPSLTKEENGVCFNVISFGASGDGSTNDTQAFVETWKAACRNKKSSSTMLIPGGKTFLVFPVELKGPCESAITVELVGTIVAPRDPNVWKAYDPSQWISFEKISGFMMQGGGTIDGQGQSWWSRSCEINSSNPCRKAPTSLVIRDSNSIRVQNLRFINSQQIHLSFSKCVGVAATGLSVLGPKTSPNTDGIHIQGSQNVMLYKSTISTGDDCISIGTGSSSIVMQDIFCGPGHGISTGSLGKQNTTAQVSNVLLDGAVLMNTTNGLRIKTWQGGKGNASGITFKNIVMDNVKNPIIIDQFYCDSKKSGSCGLSENAVQISNVVYANIQGSSATDAGIKLECSHSRPCAGIVLNNVQLKRQGGGRASIECKNAYGRADNTANSCFKVDDDDVALSSTVTLS